MSSADRLESTGRLRSHVPLGPLTTYKSGGPARWLFEAETVSDIQQLISSGLPAEHPSLVIGRGSNLVVADAGFEGLVIQLGSGFSEIERSDNEVTAGGAVPLPKLARQSVEWGLSGLEFFVGVPGSVGGAVRQNAGCFGSDTSGVLVAATLVDLVTAAERQPGPTDLQLEYRSSNVASTEVVVSATFHTERGDVSEGKAAMLEITRWRKEHQPGGTFNAGSVFKNPDHEPAGKIIDDLGLKGTRVGGVAVSEKHANFFVADTDATSADIHSLVLLIKDRVFEATGTKLEPEIQFVGFEE